MVLQGKAEVLGVCCAVLLCRKMHGETAASCTTPDTSLTVQQAGIWCITGMW